MASSRARLYVEVCDFLKETPAAIPDSGSPLAKKIGAQELGAAEFLLEQHPWNFASETKRLVIDQSADLEAEEPDASLSGFLYAYKKPAIRRINWVSATGREADRLRNGWVDKGGRILSDYNPLFVDGVLDVYADPSKIAFWSASFLTADASLIADRLTGPISNSRGWESDMSMRSRELVEIAFQFDAGQSPAPTRRPGSWSRSRSGGRPRNWGSW